MVELSGAVLVGGTLFWRKYIETLREFWCV